MRRATTILIGILLGALATGIGTGIFLKKANDDRARLAMEMQKTAQDAAESRLENAKAVEDANAKLSAANGEVAKAQALIKELREERDLAARATALVPPPVKAVRGWTDIVSLAQNVSFKLPPALKLESDTAQQMTLVMKDATVLDPRRVSFMPYDETRERELLAAFTTSTAIAYLADGHLLTGSRGLLTGSRDAIYVLRVRYAGAATHLAWLKTDAAKGLDDTVILTLLASLSFPS
jgi:hypothetical protein